MTPKDPSPPQENIEAEYIRKLLRQTGAIEQKKYRQELAELIRSIVLTKEGTERAGAYIIDTGLAVVDFAKIETSPLLPGYGVLAQAFLVVYHELLHHKNPTLSEDEIDTMQQPEHIHAALLQAIREFEKNSGIASLVERRKA